MIERTIFQLESVYREPLRIRAFHFGAPDKKTICIVGAMRGNEVQQMYVCASLVKILSRLEEKGALSKEVGITVIPCVNPYSMNIGKRFWAMDNTDINRMFPGYSLGETTQRIADGLFQKIQGYTYGIQLASFYQPGRFLTHVKHMVTEFTTDDGLADFGLPYAVRRTPRPYDTTTLNYNWQLWDTKAYSLFTHSGTDLNADSTRRAVEAILRFLQNRKMLEAALPPGHMTEIIEETDMLQVRASCGGICRMLVKIGEFVSKWKPIAEILDPYTCEVLETISAPQKALVFFHVENPLVVEGTVLFKLIQK